MKHAFIDRQGRGILIRKATEDDAVELIEYTKRVDTESPFLSREPGEFAVPVPQERLFLRTTNARKNAIFLVAVHEGQIVAAIDYHGGTRARTLHSGEFGMSVRRDYWGAGIGAHLLDTLLDWARHNGITRKIKLRVQDTNTRAIALYRSRGFVEEGRITRDMLVDGQWVDVLAMALWLEPTE